MTSPVYSPPCAACNDVIKGRYITALNQAWHPEHFVCTECNQPFQGDQVCVCVCVCVFAFVHGLSSFSLVVSIVLGTVPQTRQQAVL